MSFVLMVYATLVQMQNNVLEYDQAIVTSVGKHASLYHDTLYIYCIYYNVHEY